jgi:hypothetical protein
LLSNKGRLGDLIVGYKPNQKEWISIFRVNECTLGHTHISMNKLNFLEYFWSTKKLFNSERSKDMAELFRICN